MNQELQTTRANLPSNADHYDAYLAFANAAMSRIVGQLLKFDRFGEWHAGESGAVVPNGTEFIVHMEQLQTGWIKWDDGKPVEIHMGRLEDGFVPPLRKDLGDMDKDQWSVDDKGVPRDPWQWSAQVILKAADNDELYTYAATSRGGIQMLQALTKIWVDARKYRPDQFPVVGIDQSDYMHKKYGKIKIPVFHLMAWASREEIDRVFEGGGEGGLGMEIDSVPWEEQQGSAAQPAPQTLEPSRIKPALGVAPQPVRPIPETRQHQEPRQQQAARQQQRTAAPTARAPRF